MMVHELKEKVKKDTKQLHLEDYKHSQLTYECSLIRLKL